MDILELSVENFTSFEGFRLNLHKRGLVWVGGENRDTKGADNNGCGKSNIFKALTWGLYGETIDNEKNDKVIRRGTKRATVRVVLADAKGGQWTVRRSRSKGSPSLELLQPDGAPFKAAKGDIQSKIIELVGLDYKAFRNTSLYGQNDSARFASPLTKDTERKDMLHRILRTDQLKECHGWMLERSRSIKGDIAQAEAEIAKIDARIEEQDADSIEAEHAAFEKERLSKVDWYTTEARALRATAKELADSKPEDEDDVDVAALHARVKKLEAESKACEAAAEKVAAMEEEVATLDIEADEMEAEEKRLVARAEGLEEQLKLLEGDNCPVCSSPLDKGHAAKHLKSLTTQLADLYTERAKQAKFIKAKRQAWEEKVREKGDLEDIADEAITKVRDIAKTKAEIAAAEADAKLRAAEHERQAENIANLNARAKTALGTAREWESRPNPHDKRLKTAKGKVAEYAAAKAGHAAKRDAKAEDLAYVDFWTRGFGPQGLPSFMLDSVMPFITERANEYLVTLSDGDIKMNFSTQRELKSAKGEVRDEIEIAWVVEGLEDSYPPSGGQLKKMEIATDLALMDLVATREGGHIDLLMMDEVLDGLDPEGRTRVLQLLHELRGKRGSIFVISHDAEIAEIFEKSIHVIKQDKVSRMTAE